MVVGYETTFNLESKRNTIILKIQYVQTENKKNKDYLFTRKKKTNLMFK